MVIKERGKETLKILEQGGYEAPSGGRVELAASIDAAVSGTLMYEPDRLKALLDCSDQRGSGEPEIQVTGETTQVAARRMVEDEGCNHLSLLNFASARNPGGGFLNGAKAQEEDLARCSALYPCLLTQPRYYEINREQRSLLYTHHMIYSPGVPFFRVNSRSLLDRPFLASVITAPAPNAGCVLQERPDAQQEIEAVYRERAGMVLALARSQGHRNLLLGAWGCGVFRNSPRKAAEAFAQWLEDPRFAGAFDRVTFAVLGKSKAKPILVAFQETFAQRGALIDG